MENGKLRDLAGHLREMRDRTGLTLQQLSVRLHVSDSSLSRYFTGQTLPPWGVVAGLAELSGSDKERLRPLWQAAAHARRRALRPLTRAAAGVEGRSTAGELPLPGTDGFRRGSQPGGPAPTPAPISRRVAFSTRRAAVVVAVAVVLMGALAGVTYAAIDQRPAAEDQRGRAAASAEPSRPAPPSPATSPTGPVVAGTVVAITNDDPDDETMPYVIDVAEWSMADGAPVHLWTWRTDQADYRNQMWTVESVGSGRWRLVNLYSGKCLNRRPADGPLVQSDCGHEPDQRWVLARDGSLRSSADRRCVEIGGRRRLLGAPLRMAKCDRGWYQRWSLPQRTDY
jgi:transcriptional regulator with XRE-family HTH domain